MVSTDHTRDHGPWTRTWTWIQDLPQDLGLEFTQSRPHSAAGAVLLVDLLHRLACPTWLAHCTFCLLHIARFFRFFPAEFGFASSLPAEDADHSSGQVYEACSRQVSAGIRSVEDSTSDA